MDAAGPGGAHDDAIKLVPSQELEVQFLPGAHLGFSVKLLADDSDMRDAEGHRSPLFDDRGEPHRVLTIRATKWGPVGVVKFALTPGELDGLLECLQEAKRWW